MITKSGLVAITRKFALLTFAVPLGAAPSIVSIEPTQSQAKVVVSSSQPASCTINATQGASLGASLPDITDNGNTTARPGTLTGTATVVFVLGTRKANDALAAGANYTVQVSCSDGTVTQTFRTVPIQWGNTAPDVVPFNPSHWGNRDYPVIDWSNQTKSYVNPITGVEYWRLTGPGQINPGLHLIASGGEQILGTPADISGTGKWATSANIITNGASYSIATGGPSDKLFIPLASLGCPPGGTLAGWQPNACNLDDVSFDVWCGNAATAGITLTLQWTQDSGQTLLGNPVTTSACSTGSNAKIGTFPQLKPNPPFRSWGFTPNHGLAVPPSRAAGAGSGVNVAASAVTLQNPTDTSQYFNTEWAPGSLILINGTYYHIASMHGASTLTIAENPGTMNNVAYSGANFGVVITKSSNGNSVQVSLGANFAYSNMPSPGSTGDFPLLNPISVPVSKSADGLTTFSPALEGHLMSVCQGGGTCAMLLYVPYNPDGSYRNEVRYLSRLGNTGTSATFGQVTLNSNGDSFPYGAGLRSAPSVSPFDGVDGTSWFGADFVSPGHIFKLTYDETLPGCAGYVAYHPYPAFGDYTPNNGTAQADDCFRYLNLTPFATARDPGSQIKNAYVTGRNVLGQTVGPAHPGFDLGWICGTLSGPPGTISGGIFTFGCSTGQNRFSLTAGFRTADGVLQTVRDTWNDGDVRWAGQHAAVETMGAWLFLTGVPIEANGSGVFSQPHIANVVQVNRAGAGSPALWDCAGCPGGPQQNTSVAAYEAYTCPSNLAAPWTALSGTPNCLQLRLDSPFCNKNPDSTYVFPDAKTEKDEFPCTTPGFGLRSASWSKLQDMAAGDWLLYKAGAVGNQGESFAIVQAPQYNAVNDITLWAIRWTGHNLIYPLTGSGDDDDKNIYQVKTDPWYLGFSGNYFQNGSGEAVINLGDSTSHWIKDNPDRAHSHGAIGPGSTANQFTDIHAANSGYYVGTYDSTPQNSTFKPFLPSGKYWPNFAGSSNGASTNNSQSYLNATYVSGKATPLYFLDYRHLNPEGGGGTETNGGAGFGRVITVTPVGGTTKSYKITDCCSVAADYTRLGLLGITGRYTLKDVSSATTGNVADLADWSQCRALNVNECFQGSSVGDLYFTAPQVDIKTMCISSQITQATPCVTQPSPWTGQTVQFRTDVLDSTGIWTRKFGYVHSQPGMPYAFSNCRATPNADQVFCIADWLDGVRSEWIAQRIAPMQPLDSNNRTTFVPIQVTVPGVPFAANVRARFGYLENNSDLLHCMPYAQCSTELPSGAPTDPYSFTNESVTRQACANGATCTVTIPALPNRMLYYVIDRLDGSGNVVASTPLQTAVVP